MQYKDYTNLELGGWSNQMYSQMNDYDSVMERLYDKYKNKVQAPPELELVFMVGSSALMFHLSNAIVKSAAPDVGAILKSNPEVRYTLLSVGILRLGWTLRVMRGWGSKWGFA